MSWVKISHVQMLLIVTPITPIGGIIRTYHGRQNPLHMPPPPPPPPQGAQQQFGSTSAQQQQHPPPSSPVEQAILNLSKVVGNFVEEQKAINVQTNQKIEAVESSLNKKLDSMHSELQSSITRLSNHQQGPEKRKFTSQTHQNPRGIHEIGSVSDLNARID